MQSRFEFFISRAHGAQSPPLVFALLSALFPAFRRVAVQARRIHHVLSSLLEDSVAQDTARQRCHARALLCFLLQVVTMRLSGVLYSM